jgi:hypothetical protein
VSIACFEFRPKINNFIVVLPYRAVEETEHSELILYGKGNYFPYLLVC